MPKPVALAVPKHALALVVALALGARDAQADEPEHYFYKGYDYGAQSLYNPFYAMVNRGYDTLQLRASQPFQVNLIDVRNVAKNLADPFTPIRYDGDTGWGTFLKTEVFPLSYTKGNARWVPNYSLHLLGGGATYAWMREWFLAHEAPDLAARIFSALCLMTAALINESIENKGVVGFNTDAIADIYIFDIGGIVLYSFDAVRRFFSQTLTISDWSLQPAIVWPSGELRNVGSYYALKVPLPLVDRLKLFAYGGVDTLGGFSLKLDREYSLSAGAGVRIDWFQNIGGATVAATAVHFAPAAAVFLDRNESLLAQVQVSDITQYFIAANVYPNAFFHTEPGVGGWMEVGKDGKWLAGVSFTHALSLGFGLGTR